MDYSKQIAKLSEWISRQESLCTELQKLLIGCRAVGPESGGSGEWGKAEALRGWLLGRGIDIEQEYSAADDRVPSGKRPNFHIRLSGRKQNRRLWILVHLDVVPPGDAGAWSSDPFAAVLRDGKIYGRGSEDNNQGIVMALLVFLAFRETATVPPFDLHVLFVSDEEMSSKYGICSLLDRGLFRDGDFFLVPDGGDPEGIKIEISEKSIYWYRFIIEGIQSHASEPDKGCNAFVAGSALVLALRKLYILFPETDKLFSPPWSTFEATRKEENQQNINTIPGRDVFYMDCRLLPGINRTDLEKEIHLICTAAADEYNVKISFSAVDMMESAATQKDCLPVKALQKAVSVTRGRRAKICGFGGGTVAAWLRRSGFPAIVWSTIDGTAHMPDEYCIIANCLSDAVTAAAFTVFLQG